MGKARIFQALLVLLPAMTSLAQAQEAGPADCKLERVAQLPMTMISGHVTIPVSVNGKDATFGIDTGGPFSSLTRAAAHQLGTAGHRDDLRIGDLELARTYMGWMDSFSGVDGLIAPDVLDKYDAEFDFGANMFRLFRPHPCAGRGAYWTAAATVIPFTLTGDGHVRVAVTLDGQNSFAILDTGAPISIMSMQDAGRMFGLTPDSANIKTASTKVSGLWSSASLAAYTRGVWDYPSKAVSAYTYPFTSMTIGGMNVANPQIQVTEGRNFLGSDSAALLLGNDVLSRFHLYIAYREQKLYISKALEH